MNVERFKTYAEGYLTLVLRGQCRSPERARVVGTVGEDMVTFTFFVSPDEVHAFRQGLGGALDTLMHHLGKIHDVPVLRSPQEFQPSLVSDGAVVVHRSAGLALFREVEDPLHREMLAVLVGDTVTVRRPPARMRTTE